jgi:hypothetical protein
MTILILWLAASLILAPVVGGCIRFGTKVAE